MRFSSVQSSASGRDARSSDSPGAAGGTVHASASPLASRSPSSALTLQPPGCSSPSASRRQPCRRVHPSCCSTRGSRPVHPQLRLAVEHRFLLDQLRWICASRAVPHTGGWPSTCLAASVPAASAAKRSRCRARVQRVLEFGDQPLPGRSAAAAAVALPAALAGGLPPVRTENRPHSLLLAVGIAQLLALLLRLRAQASPTAAPACASGDGSSARDPACGSSTAGFCSRR